METNMIMKPMRPRISVIIPIFDIEKYIGPCVESVLRQTYIPAEILLINDGSRDGSLTVCRDYQNRYPNLVKVIDKVNGGLSSARNAGIKEATGEYCYFIDGDDCINEKTLEHFVDLLNQYGDLDFIHGRMSFFSDGEEYPVYRVQPYYIDNTWAKGVSDGQRAFCNAFQHQGFLQFGVRGLYNREYLKKKNLLFVEKTIPWGEDEEWTPRVFLYAEKCVGSDTPDYLYREKRENSETGKLGNIETAITMIDVYAAWAELIKDNKCSDDFRRELLQEGGRRYMMCVIKNSRVLEGDDLQHFLEYAGAKKYLLTHMRTKGKITIIKTMFSLLGIKNCGCLIHKLVKKSRLK